MKWIGFFLGMFICLTGTAIGRGVVDQTGHRVLLPERMDRIVSLAPCITEIIFSLNEGERLVGVTEHCNYPTAAADLPKVGSFIRPDIERIIGLKPDLCFSIREGNPIFLVDKLESLGIPVYIIDPRNIQEILETIQRIGDVMGASTDAADLIEKLRLRIGHIQKLVDTVSTRPRVFFQVDSSLIVTAGTNTFTHELITLAGGINLGAGPVRYPRYKWEQIMAINPDIVVITSMARGNASEVMKKQWQHWRQLTAVKQNHIYVVEPDLFTRPTPRLVDGLELLVKLIHPEFDFEN
jgi:iron complex transport system substrate-binding protein